MRYNNFVSGSYSLMYLLLAFADYIPPLISFSTISKMFISVSNSSLTFFFLSNVSSTPMWVLNGNEHDLLYKFQSICFWNFWIHLQAIGYYFLDTDEDTGLNILIQSLSRIFWHVCSQYLWYSPLLICCRIPSLWVMTSSNEISCHLCVTWDRLC